jgi:hypothetical protein
LLARDTDSKPSQHFAVVLDAPVDAQREALMSRDQLVLALQACGAFSLIYTIDEVAAGRRRRVHVEPISGQPALTREAVEFLRSLGADVEIPVPALHSRFRRAG